MAQKAFMFDLFDTLIWSPDLMDRFQEEHKELLDRYMQNPKSCAKEVEEIVDEYIANNKIGLNVYDETIHTLERMRDHGKAIVLSSSTRNGIGMTLDKTGLTKLVDGVLGAEDFPGRDKLDPELYIDAVSNVDSKGLEAVSYVDDKGKYAAAAAQSGVIPVVYCVDRKGKVTLKEAQAGNFRKIDSLDGIKAE